MRRRPLAIGGSVALVVAGVIAWRAHTPALPRAEHPDERTQARRSSMQTAAAAPALSAPRYPDVPVPATLPASLEGTEPDGAVEADAAGHLIVTLELRRLFDHFLAASGEEPIATMRARIIAVLRQRLPATAAGEAIEILDRYLAYRDAARTLAPPPSSDRISALDQVHDLRARMFSPEVARAFFADEEAAIRAALARRDILADSSLSAAERERRLAELDARAPAAVREARAQATAPIDELARETAMRAAGASDAEINATRTAALGADAAARLAELDRQHAAWNARLAQYRAARAAILADSRLGDAERQRQIDELLARSFTAQERIRVETLDHMAAGSAAR